VGLKVADATSLTPYRRNQNELIRLHQDRIDKEAALDRLNTNLEKLDGRSPAWQAANWPDLQDQRDKVNQALQNIHVTLDRTDPEWRIADAASKFPSALSLEATHKALMMGLTNPRYYQRLRNRSVAYEARAVAAEAKGDLERADSLRGQRDYLAKQADKWEATTAEQKAAALPHAEALAAHIATLKDALNDPGAFTAEKRAAAVEARDAATAALGQSLATFSEKVAKREYVKVQSAAKPVAIRYGNGEVHMAGGLADPKIAQSGLMDEYGAHNTQHMTYNPQTLVGTTKAQMKRDGTSVPVKPSEPLYYKEWAYSINKHLRNDPVARQIMAGRTDAQIADWLTSPAGIDHAKAMGWKQESDVSGQVVEDHPLTNYQAEKIADTKAVIQEYLPTPELRQQALDGEVRLSHLTRVPPEAMPTVSAGTLSAKLDRSPIARANNASQIIWDKIASDPETYVGRNPYARREYSLVLQRSVKQAEDQGYRMTPDAINAMKYSARKQALVNTEKTFYTIRRQNNLVEMSRFLTTYPAATSTRSSASTGCGWRTPVVAWPSSRRPSTCTGTSAWMRTATRSTTPPTRRTWSSRCPASALPVAATTSSPCPPSRSS
jgi:hypothetical protein